MSIYIVVVVVTYMQLQPTKINHMYLYLNIYNVLYLLVDIHNHWL